MESSRLLQVLRTFSTNEQRKFSEFVESPFFNKNIHVRHLCRHLMSHLEDSASPAEKKVLFAKMFPKETYNDEKMRNIMSDLLKLAELCLSYTNFGKDEFAVQNRLIEELASRELENVLESSTKKSQKLIDESEVKDGEFYFKQYTLQRIQRKIYEHNVPFGRHRKYFDELQSEMDNLVISFLIRMLKYYCLIAIEEKRMNVKIEKKYYFEVMDYIERNAGRFEKIPAINIYYNLLSLNGKSDNESHFTEMQRLLKKNKAFTSGEDTSFAHLHLHKYCSNKRTCLESEFNLNCYKLVRGMIDHGSFPHNGQYMTDHTFICLVSAALEAGEYEWTETFIEGQKNKLSPQKRNNVEKYLKAVLNYYRHNYGEALRLLALVKIDDCYFYLRTHNYILRCYYELNHPEQVIAVIEKFKHTLARNKTIPEGIKLKFVNYVNFLNRLCNMKSNGRQSESDELVRDINACNEIENKDWLLKSANVLIALTYSK